jgi:hypothetical protein
VPQLNALGIVASDMAKSVAFYRLLGFLSDYPIPLNAPVEIEAIVELA